MANKSKLKNYSLNEFRILVRKSMLLTSDEEEVFYGIPEEAWNIIFKTNFNSDMGYARRVLMNEENVTHVELTKLERVKEHIDNFDASVNLITDALNENKKIIFITDFDNDGSLSQSIIREFYNLLGDENKKNIHIEYARQVGENKTRGFTGELVEHLAKQHGINKNDDFLIITADNGINSYKEQVKINKAFHNATLLITDHHMPEEGMYIQENERTYVFNPKYYALDYAPAKIKKLRRIISTQSREEAYQFFKENNISGASTIGVLLKKIIQNAYDHAPQKQKEEYENSLRNIDKLSKFSNMIDYVETHPAEKPTDKKEIDSALYLQSLLNVVNSLSSLILADNNQVNTIIGKIELFLRNTKVSAMDTKVLRDNITKLHSINKVAHGLLSAQFKYNELKQEEKELHDKNTAVYQVIIKELIDGEADLLDFDNKNYLEQLRPFIYTHFVNDQKSAYDKQLMEAMIDLYDKARIVERNISQELRKTDLLQVYTADNSNIVYMNDDLQQIFNRKLINKAYNRENKGFLLTIDNAKFNGDDFTISGSFRSLYPASDIFNQSTKQSLEKMFGIKIETPGHEKAAGFIITPSKQKGSFTVSKTSMDYVLSTINTYISNRIALLKQDKDLLHIPTDMSESESFNFITDLNSIGTIDKINNAIRGNVAHFARLTPMVKLSNEDTVIVDDKTGKQTKLDEKVKEEDYGWVNIKTKLPSHGSKEESVLLPTGMLKQLANSKFTDYIRFNYFNSGRFIGEKVISGYLVQDVPELKNKTKADETLEKFFKEQTQKRIEAIAKLDAGESVDGQGLSDAEVDAVLQSTVIKLLRDDIRNNPFFNNNYYGKKDYQDFEDSIIAVIDKLGIDTYTIFDVEADGFGNANLLNIGFMNYKVNPESGEKINKNLYVFKNEMGDEFIGNKIELQEKGIIEKINVREAKQLIANNRTKLLSFGSIGSDVNEYFKLNLDSHKDFGKHTKEIFNRKLVGNEYHINRKLMAESLSYLVKKDGVIVPATITNLTGISNHMVRDYGIDIGNVDKLLKRYFENKKSLFIAHNTEYDGRITRVNLPEFNRILTDVKNYIADSATFSKSEKLMYDSVNVIRFDGIPALRGLYFYDNPYSSFNISDFVTNNEEGEYPDIKNKQHIVKTRNEDGSFTFYTKDMATNIMTQLNMSLSDIFLPKEAQQDSLFDEIEDITKTKSFNKYNNQYVKNTELSLNDIGYRAQGLGEIKFVRQMMIWNEDFNIETIEPTGALALHKDKLIEFQKNYRFNQTIGENVKNFIEFYPDSQSIAFTNEFAKFVDDFINKNKSIENKYNDSWIYQAVLSVYEPEKYQDLNKTNYEIVSQQSGIPVHLVEKVFKEAYAFKKHYKADNVITNEAHMNGPVTGNVIGDIVYEDKATIMLLNDSLSNPYKKKADLVSDTIIQHQEAFEFNFLKQEMFAFDAPIDSMSYKQAQRSQVQSDTVIKMQDKHGNLISGENNTDVRIIKFGLDEKYIQATKQIYAVVRPGVVLTEEIIDSDSEKLSKLLANLQIKDVVGDANKKDIELINKDLHERYAYIESNESMYYMTDYVKTLQNYINGDGAIDDVMNHKALTKISRATDGREVVFGYQLDIVQDLLTRQLYRDTTHDVVNIVNQKVENIVNMDMEERGARDVSQIKVMQTVDEITNEYPDVDVRIVTAMVVNAYAINQNKLYPNRTEEVVERINEEIIRRLQNNYFEMIEELKQMFNEQLLNVKRQNPLKHLVQNLNYMDYISNSLENNNHPAQQLSHKLKPV